MNSAAMKTILRHASIGGAVLAAVAGLSVVAPSAHAQAAKPTTMPSQADVAAKQKAALDALNSVNASGTSIRDQMRASGVAAGAAAMNSKAAPGSQVTLEDFNQLAKPGARPAAPATKEAPADLMIFVSLSMPRQMLERYAEQAKRFNAVMIMRGFVDDKLSTTRATLQGLNKAGASWQISPEPFTHFKIDKVPAIVMATAESASVTEEGCAAPETYTSIFGDMSVHAALDQMSRRAVSPIAVMAKSRLMADRQAAK